MIFCIQDGIWGLFASHTIRSDLGLYIVSYVFHFFAISSSVAWSICFVARLDNQIKKINLLEAAEVVRTVYAEQARGKKIDFTVDVVDVKHVNVIGDFDRITQVCNNLNGNAIKYTHEGGTIKNTVHEVPSDDPSFARFEFIVQDNGIGMSKDYIPHLFFGKFQEVVAY